MSAVDEIMSQIPMNTLAAQLGVDEATAEQAARAAIPSLLGGMQANAQDEAGAQSLANALGQHDPSLLDGGVDLNSVDTADGAAIMNHIFGGNTDQVLGALGASNLSGSADKSLLSKLIPILAPIVMAYIAKRIGGTAGAGQAGAGAAGMLQEILSQVLGGGSRARADAPAATPSSDELRIPTGQAAQPSQGGQLDMGSIITDVLGGLLGGGRR